MKLNSKQKRRLTYFIIVSIIFMTIIIGCAVPSSKGSSSSSKNNSSKETEEVTMSGSFNIKVDPNVTAMTYSINPVEYTVTALNISVTEVSTSSVVGTFNWAPVDGTTTYSVDIGQYGEYEISVVQTAVNGSDTVTTEDTVIVNIQPMKVTIVTIVPGGSLDIKIEDEDIGPSLAVFPEDFDSTALDQVPNGWLTNGVPDTYVGVINNGNAHSLPNFLRLHDENGSENASAYALIEDSTYGQLSFYFQTYDEPTTNSYIKILDQWQAWLIDICLNDSGKIEVRKPDGEKIPLMDYDLYTWYKLEIRWDKSTGYFKILINDNDYGNYQINNPSQTIGCVQFHAGTGGDPGTSAILYIDDVNLTTNTEPIILQVFTEDFETTPVDNIPDNFYIEHQDTDTFAGVVDTGITPYSLSNCLKITDNANPGYIQFNRNIEQQPYGQLTFYLYFDDTSPFAGFGIGNIMSLYFDKDTSNEINITMPDNSIINIGNFITNTWNKVTVKWDAYRFNYQVIFNNDNLGIYPFKNEDIPKAFGFGTKDPNPGNLYYIDNISLTLNPEFIE